MKAQTNKNSKNWKIWKLKIWHKIKTPKKVFHAFRLSFPQWKQDGLELNRIKAIWCRYIKKTVCYVPCLQHYIKMIRQWQKWISSIQQISMQALGAYNHTYFEHWQPIFDLGFADDYVQLYALPSFRWNWH